MALDNIADERTLYRSAIHYAANWLLFPLKMVIPQPVIAKVPGLTTNEDVRVTLVRHNVRGKLLDIGCGTNRLVREYRSQGGEGVGVDVYNWGSVDLVVENTATLPFRDGEYDTITFIACLNHIPNRKDVLLEAKRLLSPHGRLLVTNLTPLISRIWHAYAFWDDDQHERGMKEGEVYGFTRAELDDLLGGAGFIVAHRQRFSWGLNELLICTSSDG